jgi:hypothetical protein
MVYIGLWHCFTNIASMMFLLKMHGLDLAMVRPAKPGRSAWRFDCLEPRIFAMFVYSNG